MVLEMELMKMVEVNRTKLLILLVFLLISCRTESTVYKNDISKTEFCQNHNEALIFTGIYSDGFNKFFVKTPAHFSDPFTFKRKKNISKFCYYGLSNDFSFQRKTEYSHFNMHELIITDKKIIFDCLLLCFPDSIITEILSSYCDERDSVFKDIIDFGTKIIVNRTLFYHPIKATTSRYAKMTVIDFGPRSKIIEFLQILKTNGCYINLKHIDLKSLSCLSIYIPLIEQKY
jgi:hypothetical protein